jgi:L-asparaginase
MCQILIIYTGGTIGMMSDPKTNVLKPINFEQIMENVPELERLNCRIMCILLPRSSTHQT